jgi:hypothetical protein
MICSVLAVHEKKIALWPALKREMAFLAICGDRKEIREQTLP